MVASQSGGGMADGMNEAASPILHEASGRSGSVSVAEEEVFAGLRVCGFPPGPLPRATPPAKGGKSGGSQPKSHPPNPQTRQTRTPGVATHVQGALVKRADFLL